MLELEPIHDNSSCMEEVRAMNKRMTGDLNAFGVVRHVFGTARHALGALIQGQTTLWAGCITVLVIVSSVRAEVATAPAVEAKTAADPAAFMPTDTLVYA